LKWADEGVLLLNTVLTVRKGDPNSHKGKGWEQLTDEIINLLNKREQPIVFILWGKHAQEKKQFITSSQHLIIESPHPSPFSARRGFFGSKPFSKTNQYLNQHKIKEIDWCLDEF
jgi:uracil-DNA glycosylase